MHTTNQGTCQYEVYLTSLIIISSSQCDKSPMEIFVLHFRHYLWQYYINHSKKKVSAYKLVLVETEEHGQDGQQCLVSQLTFNYLCSQKVFVIFWQFVLCSTDTQATSSNKIVIEQVLCAHICDAKRADQKGLEPKTL